MRHLESRKKHMCLLLSGKKEINNQEARRETKIENHSSR